MIHLPYRPINAIACSRGPLSLFFRLLCVALAGSAVSDLSLSLPIVARIPQSLCERAGACTFAATGFGVVAVVVGFVAVVGNEWTRAGDVEGLSARVLRPRADAPRVLYHPIEFLVQPSVERCACERNGIAEAHHYTVPLAERRQCERRIPGTGLFRRVAVDTV